MSAELAFRGYSLKHNIRDNTVKGQLASWAVVSYWSTATQTAKARLLPPYLLLSQCLATLRLRQLRGCGRCMGTFSGPQPRPSRISIVIERDTTSLDARSFADGAYLRVTKGVFYKRNLPAQYTRAVTSCSHVAGLVARPRISLTAV